MTALTVPRLRVVMADGTEDVVQTRVVDLVAFDKDAARLRWPAANAAPFLWAAYLAWHVFKREGRTELGFDAFCEECVEAVPVDDDEETSTVDPTQPAATPD